MSEKSFEELIIQSVKNKIQSEIQSLQFVKIDHAQKINIPADYLNKAYQQLDWDSIISQVTKNLETRICNAIVGNMEAEIKTDVKQLLSVSGVRDKLRMEVYPNLMKVLNSEKESK